MVDRAVPDPPNVRVGVLPVCYDLTLNYRAEIVRGQSGLITRGRCHNLPVDVGLPIRQMLIRQRNADCRMFLGASEPVAVTFY
jgi:hypothetical protein